MKCFMIFCSKYCVILNNCIYLEWENTTIIFDLPLRNAAVAKYWYDFPFYLATKFSIHKKEDIKHEKSSATKQPGEHLPV